MINIGINGFGRIGKCLFLQLLNNPFVKVCAINAPNFDIATTESYLKSDSAHMYSRDFEIEITRDNSFKVNNNNVKLDDRMHQFELETVWNNIRH